VTTIKQPAKEWAYDEMRADYDAGGQNWFEVTEAFYWQALEVLPPIYLAGGFFVGEPEKSTKDGTLYAGFTQKRGRFFARYATRSTWAEAIKGLTDALNAETRAKLSPEETGVYRCQACGNTERFTGIDAHGYGGPDACEGATELAPGKAYHCPANPSTMDDSCECQTELTQDFDVVEQGATPDDAVITYHAFTGGESNAEIGSYQRIICRACLATVWEEKEGAGNVAA
jgi:hypothetical protein